MVPALRERAERLWIHRCLEGTFFLSFAWGGEGKGHTTALSTSGVLSDEWEKPGRAGEKKGDADEGN